MPSEIILNDGTPAGSNLTPLTLAEMTAELQGLLGVSAADPLYTPARLVRWLNTAQIQIAQRWPRLWHLDRRDETTWQLAAGVYRYNLAALFAPPAAEPVQTVLALALIDATRAVYQALTPYPGGSHAFAAAHPCPAGEGTGDPAHYLQTGPWVELWPVPGALEAATGIIRIDYAVAPALLALADDVVTLAGWEDEIVTLAAALARWHRARSDRELLAAAREGLALAWELINQRAEDDNPDSDEPVTLADYGPF